MYMHNVCACNMTLVDLTFSRVDTNVSSMRMVQIVVSFQQWSFCCVLCMQKAQLTYSDIDADWKTLECAATEILASCETEVDRQMIMDRLAPLRTKLAQVTESLEHKTAAQELLTEHVKARTVAEERILNVQERLKDEMVTVGEIEELRSDLGEARSQLMELECHHPEMEMLVTEAGIVVKDREMDDVVNVKDDMRKLLSKVESDDMKLNVYEEMAVINARLQETDSMLNELSEVYTDDIESLGSSVQVPSFIFMLVVFLLGRLPKVDLII